MLKVILFSILVVFGALSADPVLAQINQPSFVTGDGEAAIEQAGERIYGILAGIIAILAALAFLVGIILYMGGKAEDGKQWMMRSGLGLLGVSLVSLIYYVAG